MAASSLMLGVWLSCGGPSGKAPCATGEESCSCYGNGSCDEGLECRSDVCVATDATGGTSTGSGGGASGGSAGELGAGGEQPEGGSVGDAGSEQAGGTAVGTGGDRPTGGMSSTGGTNPTGGNPPIGGTGSSEGGAPDGGSSEGGGAPATGGLSPDGGSPPTGGTAPTGGTPPTGGSSTGGASSGDTCDDPREPAEVRNSGNFGTTDAVCYVVPAPILGWGCSNIDGRSVTVNGVAIGGYYYFEFGPGGADYASFFWY